MGSSGTGGEPNHHKQYDLEGGAGSARGRGGYDLGNMSGKKKSQISVPNSVHVSSLSARNRMDENGSESSLVPTKPASRGESNSSRTTHLDGAGITKTVSVSMRSYRYDGKM